MADGAWLDTNINAWWLDRSSPNDAAASAAFGRGMQVAQQRLEMMQQARREETATKFKMLDFALESERNELALRTFKAKQDTDLLRAKGMSEIGDYLATAVRTESLTDPETQAGFFELTSKYGPFIDEAKVNSMWDNTFGAAMRRQEKADEVRKGIHTPAVIQYQNRLREMESELDALTDPSSPDFNPGLVDEKKKEIDRFRIATRLITPEESTPMALAELRAQESEKRAQERMAHEKEMAGLRSSSQKSLQEQRAKRAAGQLKLKTDLKAINDKYSLQILQAFNDQPKKEKLIADRDKELEAVWSHYNSTFDQEPASTEDIGKEGTPAEQSGKKKFKFDPATNDLIEVK